MMFPPTPWIPQTLPDGAILKANGTYVPLPSPSSVPERSTPGSGGGANPDDGGSGGDPGFYLVVQDGVTCVGITNGMALSGTVTIPLEIAVPTNDYINGAILNVDGTEAPGGVAVVGPNNLWTFYWDTTGVPNGTHQLSAQVTFSEGSADVEATNLLTVTVSNLVSFPNYYFSSLFGQGVGMWVNAQSAVPDIDWQVWVYDSQSNYLGYFYGSTNNGSINFEWGLQTNADYPPLQDATFTLAYYLFNPVTHASLSGKKPAAMKFKIGEKPWTPSEMMIACAPIDNNSLHTEQIGTLVEEAVVNVCYGSAAFPGGLAPLGWNQANGQSAWMWSSSGNGSDLLDDMPQCQFLYYLGHGSPNSFGIAPWTTKPNVPGNVPWSDLTAAEISIQLGNFAVPGVNGNTGLQGNSLPYKLVFIDGCTSGTGGLPSAFGIPPFPYSTNNFAAAGVRSRAFVGYTKPVSLSVTDIPGYEPTVEAFWDGWLNKQHSVHEVVTNCQSAVIFSYPMSGNAVIYGATDMDKFVY